MNTASIGKRISTLVVIASFALVLGGCSGKSQNQPAAGIGELPPLANSVGSFGDLELPVEMKLDQDKTMSINTESFKGGILHYKGRVEVTSLKDFIVASIPQQTEQDLHGRPRRRLWRPPWQNARHPLCSG